jgi:pimeloyl-ACP methyl ester carboxylesterase
MPFTAGLTLAESVANETFSELMPFQPDRPGSYLERRYATEASRVVQLENARVHYRDEGSGPPLVLLHGTFASLHAWDGWVAELHQDYRCLRMDLPGFGLTGPWSHDYTIDAYVPFIEAFATTLDLDSFALVGHSLGGAIAWRYALEYDRVTQLVLVAPFGYPSRRYPLAITLGRIPLLRRLFPVATPRLFVAYNVRSAYGDRQQVAPETIDRYHALLMRDGNREAALHVIRHLRPQRTSDLVDIDMPTLVLWGTADRWIHPDNAARFGQYP